MTNIKKFFSRVAGSRGDVDMAEGSIVRHLLTFALPLMLGNLFQQLYNTVDTWVVGNFVSNEAFSAVGTVGPITNLLIGFFSGLATGAGVVIAQFYGAGKHDRVNDAVHTALMLTAVLGVAFTVIGIGMTPLMLHLMKTPEEVLPEAKTYLTIYFSGTIGLLFYNMGAGILRAVGDSVKPFLFLVVSALVNTSLDLLFVLAFGMGVEGVAYATIIAEAISAVLVFITLHKAENCVHFSPKRLKFHTDILKKMISVGFPAALQMAVTSFSNVFVQSYINYFGKDCMSGWTAYSKIDTLVLLPIQSIALATTTFVGQNLGKGDSKRARRGVNIALLMSVISAIILMIPIILFAPGLVSFFNDKEEVVTFGSLFLRYISPFYVLCCANQIYAGALRGAGNSRAPMIIMLLSFVAFRQVYLFVMANYISNTVLPIVLSYPAGWLVCSTSIAIYFFKTDLTKNRLVDKEPAKEET